MKTNRPVKKSFATKSAKPNDVQYRLKRAAAVADQLEMFLDSIDPAVFGDGQLEGVLSRLVLIQGDIERLAAIAPAKGRRGRKAEAVEEVAEDLTDSDVPSDEEMAEAQAAEVA